MVRGLVIHFLGTTRFDLECVSNIPRTKEGKLVHETQKFEQDLLGMQFAECRCFSLGINSQVFL
jgi:hypothetical protein